MTLHHDDRVQSRCWTKSTGEHNVVYINFFFFFQWWSWDAFNRTATQPSYTLPPPEFIGQYMPDFVCWCAEASGPPHCESETDCHTTLRLRQGLQSSPRCLLETWSVDVRSYHFVSKTYWCQSQLSSETRKKKLLDLLLVAFYKLSWQGSVESCQT